jgi:hypothetical protein
MDEIVEAALKKWPNVPHCYGWLGLDARGAWYLRDELAQAAGAFAQVKGSRIRNDRLREFIERNYARDATGCWFFQNGPQRVYVELEAAPWVWRLQRQGDTTAIVSHTGAAARFESAWLDDRGRVFIVTDIGPGVVHTLDMEWAADAIEQGRWAVADLAFDRMPQHFGYVLSPQPGR